MLKSNRLRRQYQPRYQPINRLIDRLAVSSARRLPSLSLAEPERIVRPRVGAFSGWFSRTWSERGGALRGSTTGTLTPE